MKNKSSQKKPEKNRNRIKLLSLLILLFMAGILGNQYFKEISTFFKNTLSGNSGTRTAGGKSEGFTIGESGESTGVKVALVIGNKDYTKMPALVNPLNDARDLEKSLRELGCEVLLKENLKTKKEMKLALGEFREELGKKKAEIGIFFYAGHGLQGNDGKNYLVPTDVKQTGNQADIEDEMLPLDYVLTSMNGVGCQTKIVLLDACRNLGASRGAEEQGWGKSNAANGLYIIYGTSPGKTASDNTQETNGLFTKHLLKNLTKEGLELKEVISEVREGVLKESEKRGVEQWVYEEGGYLGKLYFAGKPKKVEENKPREMKEWEQELLVMENEYLKLKLKESVRVEGWEGFLERYRENNPQSERDEELKSEAREKIIALKKKEPEKVENLQKSPQKYPQN
jgi:hypothetical protein